MDVRGLVDAELDTTKAGLINHARQVFGGQNGARLGAGHEAAGTQHAAQFADHAHHVGRGKDDVKVGPALLNARGQVLGAHVVGACFGGAAPGPRARQRRGCALRGRCRPEASPRRAPAGRRSAGPHPCAGELPPSRRTWRLASFLDQCQPRTRRIGLRAVYFIL